MFVLPSGAKLLKRVRELFVRIHEENLTYIGEALAGQYLPARIAEGLRVRTPCLLIPYAAVYMVSSSTQTSVPTQIPPARSSQNDTTPQA